METLDNSNKIHLIIFFIKNKEYRYVGKQEGDGNFTYRIIFLTFYYENKTKTKFFHNQKFNKGKNI